MRSPLVWLVLPGFACLHLIWFFSRGQSLLADSDTRVLLAMIRETKNPWAWFTGDWPLENHFYRPISTLFFELDNALYGNQAWGYGLTNTLLVVAGVFLLFWLIGELIEDWPLAGLVSGTFAFWHWSSPLDLEILPLVFYVLAGAALLGFRHGLDKAKQIVPVVLAFLWLAVYYGPVQSQFGRMINWIPGRTASVMVVFCLAAMACYVHWERLTARARPFESAKSTDKPLRAETPLPTPAQKAWAWAWLLGSFVACALALGSYEQAIMLPALLLGAAILMFARGYRPRWGIHVGYWAMMGGYLVLRNALVPSQVSGYQAQQFRDGPGVLLDLGRYLIPPVEGGIGLVNSWTDFFILLTSSFWGPVLQIVGFVAIVVIVCKDEQRWSVAGFWLMAFVAFLPMAWFKMFEHYHHWSTAFRAAALVLMVGAVLRCFTAAVSPRGRQAPPRSDPAPGSLLHP